MAFCWYEKPKPATKGKKVQMETRLNEKPERATKNNEKAAKSYEERQKATTDIGTGKAKTGKKKPKRATKGTKSPNGNQALECQSALLQYQDKSIIDSFQLKQGVTQTANIRVGQGVLAGEDETACLVDSM